MFSNDFVYKLLKTKCDGDGNFIVLDVEIEGKRISLVNLYGPNEDSR